VFTETHTVAFFIMNGGEVPSIRQHVLLATVRRGFG
jgi:hypothetical protein